ncbi:MAG: hypothetical protein HQK51_12250 [Oligoflexia bacterium]|nr:hypothetical protein [Oligoflexia bacterium]
MQVFQQFTKIIPINNFKKIIDNAGNAFVTTMSLVVMTFSPSVFAWQCNSKCELYQLDCWAFKAGCETVKNLCIPGIAAAEEQVRRSNGSGSGLSVSQKEKLRPFFGELVDRVRVHYKSLLSGEVCWNNKCLTYGYAGQTFGHDVYLVDQITEDDVNQLSTIAHEMKHIEQIERVGTGIKWYANYCTHWVYDNTYSYEKNSLEREAYEFENYFIDNVDHPPVRPAPIENNENDFSKIIPIIVNLILN